MIKRSKRRMAICYGLLVFLLAFIWGNSLMPGRISGAFSNWVKQVLTDLFPFLFSGMSESTGGGLLRKVAHFSEFTALGACFCWLYAMLKNKQYEQLLFPLLSGFLVACADETIQRFVPDRHGCLTDVGIDTAGVTMGIVLFTIAYHIYKYKHQSMEEMK